MEIAGNLLKATNFLGSEQRLEKNCVRLVLVCENRILQNISLDEGNIDPFSAWMRSGEKTESRYSKWQYYSFFRIEQTTWILYMSAVCIAEEIISQVLRIAVALSA